MIYKITFKQNGVYKVKEFDEDGAIEARKKLRENKDPNLLYWIYPELREDDKRPKKTKGK